MGRFGGANHPSREGAPLALGGAAPAREVGRRRAEIDAGAWAGTPLFLPWDSHRYPYDKTSGFCQSAGFINEAMKIILGSIGREVIYRLAMIKRIVMGIVGGVGMALLLAYVGAAFAAHRAVWP